MLAGGFNRVWTGSYEGCNTEANANSESEIRAFSRRKEDPSKLLSAFFNRDQLCSISHLNSIAFLEGRKHSSLTSFPRFPY